VVCESSILAKSLFQGLFVRASGYWVLVDIQRRFCANAYIVGSFSCAIQPFLFFLHDPSRFTPCQATRNFSFSPTGPWYPNVSLNPRARTSDTSN
jgi:hypothetical protein